MNLNDRPQYGGGAYHHQPWGDKPAPRPEEKVIQSREVQVERKRFQIALHENARGRFLRIKEEAGSRRNMIIVPSTGAADFLKVLEEICKCDAETGPVELPEEQQPQPPYMEPPPPPNRRRYPTKPRDLE